MLEISSVLRFHKTLCCRLVGTLSLRGGQTRRGEEKVLLGAELDRLVSLPGLPRCQEPLEVSVHLRVQVKADLLLRLVPQQVVDAIENISCEYSMMNKNLF